MGELNITASDLFLHRLFVAPEVADKLTPNACNGRAESRIHCQARVVYDHSNRKCIVRIYERCTGFVNGKLSGVCLSELQEFEQVKATGFQAGRANVHFLEKW